MSSLLLQINLDLQAGSAINVLNAIESNVDKIVGKLQQFSQIFNSNPITIIQSKQLDTAVSLVNTMKDMDNIGASLTVDRAEDLANAKRTLDVFVAQAQQLQAGGDVVQGLLEAETKRNSINNQFSKFHEKSKKFYDDNEKKINLILKNKLSQVKLTKAELKEYNNLVKSLDIAVKLGGTHLAQLGFTAEKAAELHGALEKAEFSTKRQVNAWVDVKNAMIGFVSIITEAGVLV